jgi:hypothetical protein
MLTKIAFSKLGSSCLAVAALGSFAMGGCGSPPDTSPAVTITSPVNGQTLPAGMPIDVRFTVSGYDSSAGGMVPFTLVGTDMKVVGQGQVQAFLSTGNFIARTESIPNDKSPFLIPDPSGQYGTAAQLVTTGSKKITLHLFYNGSPVTDVVPQREGTVTVNIQ